jgi:hypothetical protein
VHRVFISYVQQDSAIAIEVADGLTAGGYQAWYAERDALPGPTFRAQVRDAVRGSKALVLIVSRHALLSDQVGNEIIAGLEHNVTFVPLLSGVDDSAIAASRPAWTTALGSAVSVPIPGAGVTAVLPEILRSLKQHGIAPVSFGRQFAEPPQVHVFSPGQTEHVFALRENGLTLGRDPESDVLLLDDEVSRRHARLDWKRERIDVTDLSSKNGTKIGGTKLTPGEPYLWKPDELLEIGPFQLRLSHSAG